MHESYAQSICLDLVSKLNPKYLKYNMILIRSTKDVDITYVLNIGNINITS